LRKIRPSRWPGTGTAAAFGTAAWLFLLTHRGLSSGSDTAWAVYVAVYGLLAFSTLGLAWVEDRHRLVLLLAFKNLVLFWSCLPDQALLPVRWLAYAALAAEAASSLPGWWKTLLVGTTGASFVLVQNLLPGMTAGEVDPGLTAVALLALLVPAFLLHLVRSTGTKLDTQLDRNDQLHASVLQLTSANTAFLEQANNAGEESAVSERHRITRDLHDVVGQTLTNIIMMMDAALHRKAHEPEETVKLLRWIRKQAQTGLEETRSVLYELRSFRPETLRGLKALKKLVETFTRLSRIRCKVEWGNLPWTFDPEQEKAVYHLVQESLSNAFRHGSATRVDLQFQVDRGLLHIMVRDNGTGGADAAAGIGQRGMEERFARWNGTVGFKSEPFGYVVTGALPLVEEGTPG